MSSATLILSLSAGMVAAINPCGFSLLPAYVGFFVSGDGDRAPLDRRLARAISSAGAVTAGFVVVFVALGIALSSTTDRIRGQLPWVTIAIGLLLVIGGGASILGRPLPMPAITVRAARGRGPVAMGTYGVAYALASLSCTIGPFLAITASAMDESVLAGIGAYVAYGVGMGAIILALGVSAALARPWPVAELRRLSRYAPRIGGGLMILSGAYAIWYARWELSVYGGDLRNDRFVEVGERWRLSLQAWLERIGPVQVVVVIAVVTFAVAFAGRRSSGRSSPTGSD